jgi:hypothetical protein
MHHDRYTYSPRLNQRGWRRTRERDEIAPGLDGGEPFLSRSTRPTMVMLPGDADKAGHVESSL